MALIVKDQVTCLSDADVDFMEANIRCTEFTHESRAMFSVRWISHRDNLAVHCRTKTELLRSGTEAASWITGNQLDDT